MRHLFLVYAEASRHPIYMIQTKTRAAPLKTGPYRTKKSRSQVSITETKIKNNLEHQRVVAKKHETIKDIIYDAGRISRTSLLSSNGQLKNFKSKFVLLANSKTRQRRSAQDLPRKARARTDAAASTPSKKSALKPVETEDNLEEYGASLEAINVDTETVDWRRLFHGDRQLKSEYQDFSLSQRHLYFQLVGMVREMALRKGVFDQTQSATFGTRQLGIALFSRLFA